MFYAYKQKPYDYVLFELLAKPSRPMNAIDMQSLLVDEEKSQNALIFKRHLKAAINFYGVNIFYTRTQHMHAFPHS